MILMLVGGFLSIKAQTLDTLWHENFEGNWTDNWHVDAGTWEVGVPTSGPNMAYRGDNCAATVLGGNYSDGVSTRLIRHTEFIVPAADQNPYLRFYHWFNLHNGDFFQVQIKTSSGDWEELGVKHSAAQGSAVWSPGIAFLHEYAGKTVSIAFYFYSTNYAGGGTETHVGCYVDEISVVSGAVHFDNPEDWSEGIRNWGSDYGNWEWGEPEVGPSIAHSGTHCVGTNLKGNYQDGARSRLISMPISIAPDATSPALRFWHWFNFHNGDYGQVQIKEIGQQD